MTGRRATAAGGVREVLRSEWDPANERATAASGVRCVLEEVAR